VQCRKSVEHSGYQFDAVQNGYGSGSVLCVDITAITDKGMVVLQNCLDSQEEVPGLHSEACSSLSLNGVQAVDIKFQEFLDIEDSEDPVPMTVIGLKAECEVSCMSPLCHCEAYLSHIQNCLFSL
jgi:hypothetical protein